MPKIRDIHFENTGSSAYAKVQALAFALRSHYDWKLAAYYDAEQGTIPSRLGIWADEVYVRTNAPMYVVRKLAKVESLRVRATR